MTTTAVSIPTTFGDTINPVNLFGAGSAPVSTTTVRFFGNRVVNYGYGTLPGPYMSTQGDSINPVDLSAIGGAAPVTQTTMRLLLQSSRNFPLSDMSQWRGWSFVIDPATVQPQVPRSTSFPGAQ